MNENTARPSLLRRALARPQTCVATAVFFALAASVVFFSLRNARRSAEDTLLAAATDIREDIICCVDDCLIYQGEAIVKHYREPSAMTESAVEEVMHRYDLDELNVVNEKGIVIMGAIADRGFDMASNPLTAEFNRLLKGGKTYSQPFRGAIENPDLRRKYVGVAFPPPAKGYIQMGYEERRLKDGFDYWFADVAVDWHIGETGFFVIAKEESGVIDSCGLEAGDGVRVHAEGDTLRSIGFDAASAPEDPREFFTAVLHGRKCLCLTSVHCYHRVIAALPYKEIYFGVILFDLGVTAALFVLLVIVVLSLTSLSELVARLKAFIAADKEKTEKEYALAKTIQLSALPPDSPDLPDWRIFARMDTAREVGGDFFDYTVMPDGKVFFAIADVSGKGIPAAMFMMKAKTTIRGCVFVTPSLQAAVAAANDRLAENNDANMFVTAWLGLFDPRTGELEYVNAGHNPPLVNGADGTVRWLPERHGLVLAAMGGRPYAVGRLTLRRGDSLLLYTDGVTEAMNAGGELYGEDRLKRAFEASSETFLPDVRRDVDAFVAGAEQSDDITMLALYYKNLPSPQ